MLGGPLTGNSLREQTVSHEGARHKARRPRSDADKQWSALMGRPHSKLTIHYGDTISMGVLLITYDLSKPGRNYDELLKRIKSYGTFAEITESSWTIVTEQSPVMVRDHLNPALDSNDKLFVGILFGSAWIGLDDNISDWLKENL